MIGLRNGNGALHLHVMTYFSFWIAKLSKYCLKNRLIILRAVYVHDSREDVFSRREGSIDKLLAGHLLRYDSRLREDMSRQ